MDGKTAGLLMLATLCGIGLLIIFIGYLFKAIPGRKAKKCTATTIGHVVDHYFQNTDHNMYAGPVVEFKNEHGNTYKAEMKFDGIIEKTNSGRKGLDNAMWVDSKNILHIVYGRRGRSLQTMAENLWPIGSEMTVYYDPNDPMINNYVERPVKNASLFKWLSIAGVGLMLLGILMCILGYNGILD